MSILTPNTLPIADQLHRFSLADYQAMIDVGVIDEDDPVELLDGWIINKTTRTPLHDAWISWIANRVLGPSMPPGWFCRVQMAMSTRASMPEPDIALVRGQERDYTSRHPGPADIALIIEVSDSTLARDRGLKARIYAEAGILAYWIVNLDERILEVMTNPSGPGDTPTFLTRAALGPDDSVQLLLPEGVPLAIPARVLIP